MASKSNILLVGCGGVGSITALNLETGGLAAVTAVLRSNFNAVKSAGFNIKSCDHGSISGWRPTQVVNNIPNVSKQALQPYDYVVCTTKNVADVPPSLSDLIAPAVTPEHSVIVLIQNGLNIENPVFAAFPQNIVLSGISMIGSHEWSHGNIEHDDNDLLDIGPFRNPLLNQEKEESAAAEFVRIYSAGGKTVCKYKPDVGWGRWRKLIYNACLNPICAITSLDTGRIRLADDAIAGLVKPAMEEIRAAAKAMGHDLPEDIADTMINIDPLTMYLPPSMMGDMKKVSTLSV